ncbi:MAG: hypothetical protein ACJAZD_002933, partial [Ilumatobacter sp.]
HEGRDLRPSLTSATWVKIVFLASL